LKPFLYLSTLNMGLQSALIRFGTRCEWSHAGFYDAEQDTYLSAHIDGGVRVRTWGEERYSKACLYTAPGIEDAYKWALTQVGKRYDWKAIIGIASNKDWHDQDHYICSELVAMAFEVTGKPLLNPDAQVWRITPRDLLLARDVKKAFAC
jgi:uncharacterized protein YycO